MVERGKLGEVREGQEGGGEGERRLVTTQLSLYRITVLILKCVSSTPPFPLTILCCLCHHWGVCCAWSEGDRCVHPCQRLYVGGTRIAQ